MTKGELLPRCTPILFPVGSRIRHKKGGLYRVLATPDVCYIERTLEPAYAYIAAEGTIWIRPQQEMEDGRFQKLGSIESADYEDILEMVTSGDGLAERQAAMGLNFLSVSPRAAWDIFIAALCRSRDSAVTLSRFLNQVQFEATELRNFFLKRRG